MSEIVFGQQISDFTSSSFINHAVEIYNPTDDPIDLSTYSISLLSMDDQETFIRLQGFLQSGDVYVISNTLASSEVATKTDNLSAVLDFSNKKMIKLWHANSVIDKLGNSGDNIDNSPIDFDRLLNDAEYLNGLEVNLGTLSGLDIRRFVSVVVGNADFVNADFLLEWTYYPSFVVNSLGEHGGVCQTPMLLWANVDFEGKPEEELKEYLGAIVDEGGTILQEPFEYASRDVILSEAVDHDVLFSVFFTEYEYTQYNDDDASITDYGLTQDFTDPNQIFVIPAGETRYEFKNQVYAIVDNEDENPEGTGFVVDANFPVDAQHDCFDIRIVPEVTSTKELIVYQDVKLFPTITNRTINIESDNILVGVSLFSLRGKLIRNYSFGNEKNIQLDIPIHLQRGYYLLLVKTIEGTVTKKFYKF